jgi:cytochrome-b5 reductase
MRRGTASSLRKVSAAELETHRSPSDCWVAIHGNVYDVTHWLNDHPGGADIILGVAGGDVTQDFDDTGHTNYAVNLLERYYVGVLGDRDDHVPSPRNSPPPATKIASLVSVKGQKRAPRGSSQRVVVIVLVVGLIVVVFFVMQRSKPVATVQAVKV